MLHTDGQLQAKYTDLLLLSKSHLVSEHDLDILMDHLGTLNDETARIRVGPDNPVRPEVIFGLDTALWSKSRAEGEEAAWADLGGSGSTSKGGHSDEVETATVWRGGSRPGKQGTRQVCGHAHVDGEECDSGHGTGANGTLSAQEAADGDLVPLERAKLEEELGKLSFEIYRGESPYPTQRERAR